MGQQSSFFSTTFQLYYATPRCYLVKECLIFRRPGTCFSEIYSAPFLLTHLWQGRRNSIRLPFKFSFVKVFKLHLIGVFQLYFELVRTSATCLKQFF